MGDTIISWTNVSWNPAHGCSKVSEGCRNCYAERISLEKGFTHKPWTAANAKENVMLKPHKLNDVRKFKPGSRVFVNSMSDLFHELIPDEYISQVFRVMNDNPLLTFQILTKRPVRAAAWEGPWMDNIWMGTSVEDQKNTRRLDQLRTCKAKTLFISFEPLISEITEADLTGYHWAIVGGESGPGFRPMPHEWARTIRDMCFRAGVAFFFKQSAAYRTETKTALEHTDGKLWKWEQYPNELVPPWEVNKKGEPVNGEPARFTPPVPEEPAPQIPAQPALF